LAATCKKVVTIPAAIEWLQSPISLVFT